MKSIDDILKMKFENSRHKFIANLVYTTHHFENLVDDYLKPYNLSQQQFNILRILRGAKKPVTMNTIKELMIDQSSNLTRTSDKLISKSLVARHRSEEDRRIVYLDITTEGLELLTKLDKDNSGKHLTFLSRITEEEALMFSKILDKIRG